MQEGGGDWKIKQSHAEEKYGKKIKFFQKIFYIIFEKFECFSHVISTCNCFICD